MQNGILYIISAPSGGGKTSLVRALVSIVDNLVISVSHTTRPARPGEIDGENYHFVTREQFQNLLNQNIFLEHATVFGYDYGTSRNSVLSQLNAGKDVILEIDWQGAQQIRHHFSNNLSIFILPPSLDVLRKRLCERAQDSNEVIEKRMQQAQAEISHYHEFDYLIVNDNFDQAVYDLASIIHARRLNGVRQAIRYKELIENLLAY